MRPGLGGVSHRAREVEALLGDVPVAEDHEGLGDLHDPVHRVLAAGTVERRHVALAGSTVDARLELRNVTDAGAALPTSSSGDQPPLLSAMP